ncbi:hypothetical protein GA0116948_109108 [Chitinophaga costaii]|uniref:Uncharacterized protein n=1 Tax=Chitinophaga costaii TaxID=1335309 RepID=A0A1C4EQ82_9BACT|nr:hypothetical protein [Chitinophaga costaii]SCC45717.1 hypothetical protein GA0116948_109108 [Chitinophaga costaii]
MDQLKLKLKAYYQRYQQLDAKTKPAAGQGDKEEVADMEHDILSQFGLPASKRFVQILHDFVTHRQFNEQLVDYVSKKLKTAASKYLLAPVLSDVEQLSHAHDQKRSAYDVLPELGFPTNEYSLYLVGELLYKRNMSASDILDELQKVQHFDDWEDLLLLSKINNYKEDALYAKLKKHHLRFLNEFVQYVRKQALAAASHKRLTPAEEGYAPNYRTVTKVLVEDIVFDQDTTPSIFGKVRINGRLTRVTIGLEFSELNQLLMTSDELGVEISSLIKKKLSSPAVEKPLVIDVRAQFGQELKLDNCYLEVYKPQHRDSKHKWVEDKDPFYFVDKILSKKEFDKRSKEVEVKQKIQECLELIGGSYVYYQRLRRLDITEDEAKLRAGLGDELLFKLSYFLNKLKE